MLDFPSAIREVIRGRAVTRFEWMNPAIYLVMTEGYLKIRKADTTQHVLLVSDADMLADDWRIVSMDDDDGA